MKLRFAVLALGAVFASPALAQMAPPIPQLEVFAGGSYYRAGFSNGINMEGWEAAFDYNLSKHAGVVLDFGGQYDRTPTFTRANYQYLIGPQLKRRTRQFTFFARGLVGGDAVHFPNSTRGGFAVGGGGGVDLNIGKFAAIRLIQIDSLHNHFGGAWDHNLRASVGVVFKFKGP